MRRLVTKWAACGAVVLTAGCTSGGLGAVELPGTQGRGDDAYVVQVELANASDLYPNSRVMVNNVDVGTVSKIRVDGWHAVATVSLNGDVDLPANAVATVGQTSLLGAKHLAIESPAGGAAHGKLGDGDRIPLTSSRSYPDTEDVLASASLLLNGGGLEQVRTITSELNKALGDGRAERARQVLRKLDRVSSSLSGQLGEITDALDGLDRLFIQARKHDKVIKKVLDDIPEALDTLDEERPHLMKALASMSKFSRTASGTVRELRGPLTRNLNNLTPVMKELADAGPSLVGSTGLLPTGLFPLKTNRSLFKGDYANLAIIVDLTNTAINKYYLALLMGTPLSDLLPGGDGSDVKPDEDDGKSKNPYEGLTGTGPLPAPPPSNEEDPSVKAGGVNDLLNDLTGALTGGLVGEK